MNPGPAIFMNNVSQIYAVFLVFFLANLLMIPFGWACIKAAKRILDVPHNPLMPVILLFCIVGAFAINNTVFAVWIILVFGVVAYFMEENGFPIAPVILGVILGTMLEENFITSMIKSDGRFIAFFERPIAATLGVATLLVWFWPLARAVLSRRHSARPAR
jgi:TctA family transporter